MFMDRWYRPVGTVVLLCLPLAFGFGVAGYQTVGAVFGLVGLVGFFVCMIGALWSI